MKLKERYIRNFNTFSPEDQENLGNSSVAVIGLGGLGGGVCEILARTGVGSLHLIDGDVFEVSNLNRQLLSQEHLIGIPKTEAAAARIKAVNSDIRLSHYTGFLDKSNFYEHIKNTDLVVDCLDSIDSRFKLRDAAEKANIPIVSGAIAGLTGQLTVIFPGDAGYKLIYGEKSREQSRGIETETGNTACCALFVAALQASECIKILLQRGDILRNKLLIADLLSNTFEVISLC